MSKHVLVQLLRRVVAQKRYRRRVHARGEQALRRHPDTV
jgi:hypothetical protein